MHVDNWRHRTSQQWSEDLSVDRNSQHSEDLGHVKDRNNQQSEDLGHVKDKNNQWSGDRNFLRSEDVTLDADRGNGREREELRATYTEVNCSTETFIRQILKSTGDVRLLNSC